MADDNGGTSQDATGQNKSILTPSITDFPLQERVGSRIINNDNRDVAEIKENETGLANKQLERHETESHRVILKDFAGNADFLIKFQKLDSKFSSFFSQQRQSSDTSGSDNITLHANVNVGEKVANKNHETESKRPITKACYLDENKIEKITTIPSDNDNINENVDTKVDLLENNTPKTVKTEYRDDKLSQIVKTASTDKNIIDKPTFTSHKSSYSVSGTIITLLSDILDILGSCRTEQQLLQIKNTDDKKEHVLTEVNTNYSDKDKARNYVIKAHKAISVNNSKSANEYLIEAQKICPSINVLASQLRKTIAMNSINDQLLKTSTKVNFINEKAILTTIHQENSVTCQETANSLASNIDVETENSIKQHSNNTVSGNLDKERIADITNDYDCYVNKRKKEAEINNKALYDHDKIELVLKMANIEQNKEHAESKNTFEAKKCGINKQTDQCNMMKQNVSSGQPLINANNINSKHTSTNSNEDRHISNTTSSGNVNNSAEMSKHSKKHVEKDVETGVESSQKTSSNENYNIPEQSHTNTEYLFSTEQAESSLDNNSCSANPNHISTSNSSHQDIAYDDNKLEVVPGKKDVKVDFIRKTERSCSSEHAKDILIKVPDTNYNSEDTNNNYIANSKSADNIKHIYKDIPHEDSKPEAMKSIKVAQKALSTGNHVKAEHFLRKAERLYPTECAKDLLKKIHSTFSVANSNNDMVDNSTYTSNNEQSQRKVDYDRKSEGLEFSRNDQTALSNENYEKNEHFLKKTEYLHVKEQTKDLLTKISCTTDSSGNTINNNSSKKSTCQSNLKKSHELDINRHSKLKKEEEGKCTGFEQNPSSTGNIIKAKGIRKAEEPYSTEHAKYLSNPLLNLNSTKLKKNNYEENIENTSAPKETFDEIIYKDKKSEAEKCIKIASKAISVGNIIKAKNILSKAERIYSTEQAKDLLEQISTENKGTCNFIESEEQNLIKAQNGEERNIEIEQSAQNKTSAKNRVKATQFNQKIGNENKINEDWKGLEIVKDACTIGNIMKTERVASKNEHLAKHTSHLRKDMLDSNRGEMSNTVREENIGSTSTTTKTFDEVIYKDKKGDAEKCIKVACKAISTGNLIKAENMLRKAERLYPTEQAKDLLKQITTKNNSDDSNENNTSLQNSIQEQNAEDRKIEADIYVESAQNALAAKNFEKARRLLLKAERLFASPRTKDLLKQVEAIEKEEASKNATNPETRTNIQSTTHKEKEEVEKKPDILPKEKVTPEQIEAVQRINCRSTDILEILGLNRNASVKTIKAKIKTLMVILHPDRNLAPGADEAFMKVREAAEKIKEQLKF